ncbi:1-acyl-sn-glycerol-3-phosphate acyltransferase [Mycolicibacterium sp.]|uniref:1-acyl-sn-glycerol-3-phosphate acyltransferase n=1 Tax=Mycolicibacterium sp. TaxID=2320850 RepID=UPI0037C56116
MRPVVKVYHRSAVLGLERIPAGRCLLVGNHSGGLLTPDFAIFAVDYYERFGFDKPLYVLGHDSMFHGPAADVLPHLGVIQASPDNAAAALATESAVMVYPGGDMEVYRPTVEENVIDFAGHTGYVQTAVDAGAPIVPVVSIGGQETQMYLSRGRWLARALRVDRWERRVLRTDILPVTFGFPFGLSVLIPVNVPLPSKIVTQVLDPIDVVGQWGPHPDPEKVDGRIRREMQAELDRLRRRRRLPIIG